MPRWIIKLDFKVEVFGLLVLDGYIQTCTSFTTGTQTWRVKTSSWTSIERVSVLSNTTLGHRRSYFTTSISICLAWYWQMIPCFRWIHVRFFYQLEMDMKVCTTGFSSPPSWRLGRLSNSLRKFGWLHTANSTKTVSLITAFPAKSSQMCFIIMVANARELYHYTRAQRSTFIGTAVVLRLSYGTWVHCCWLQCISVTHLFDGSQGERATGLESAQRVFASLYVTQFPTCE